MRKSVLKAVFPLRKPLHEGKRLSKLTYLNLISQISMNAKVHLAKMEGHASIELMHTNANA